MKQTNKSRDAEGGKIAALYLRTSTADKQDTAAQELELRILVQARGWKIHKVYRDHGYSGTKASRPAFDEMWRDCRRGKIQVVCVWAIDRFSRSLKHLIEGLEELHRLQIDFVSLKQDLDSSSPSGKLLFQIVGAVAEFEHQLIRSRIITGLAEARRKGTRLGRRPTRILSEAEVKMIRAGRSKGITLRKLAMQFNAPLTAVYRASVE